MGENIGERILRLRIKNEMKQKELADKVGITEATLSRYENGLRSPKGEIVSKLAEALGVSSDYLLGLTDEVKEQSKNEIKNLDIIPEQFTDPEQARAYVKKHRIFASEGFNADKIDDEKILEFANALLEQMKLIGYKYEKKIKGNK
ncbi:Helix-turn-helix [Clostridium sp. USBA 49]|uniref:helix-turn-helix domain-containing protein n=1 Tax=Clostridium sp. USBA 49 TaxID=1881060 RepID=UPI000999B424|nr:helix-turn-helix transcriptional regulator [Clostridium sp. USBA 49]SKA89515.1 Helix-turn-helix [Clostridium sp. USBA 49]